MPDPLALPDWRRRVAELYGAVRATSPEVGHTRWRETRDRLFRTHPATPLTEAQRAVFPGLDYYPYDPRLRLEVPVLPATGPTVEADVGRDGTLRYRPLCRTDGLSALGGELTLYWIEGYGGGLFLPFRDATTGAGTYGGGRYLIDAIKGADLGMRAGRLILDFNFAYNPSCSYGPDWVCPLSPPENRLSAAIEAGEKTPGAWAV